MRLLLDTHTFLWWLLNDERLSPTARTAILNVSNQLYLSSASGFEIATKVAVGKLKLPTSVESFIATGVLNGQIEELAITMRHGCRVERLPLHHRDPFDRLLIATALEEDLTLLTNDTEIQKYPVKLAW